jgi:tetratricopeptide (TPR) repeat protein
MKRWLLAAVLGGWALAAGGSAWAQDTVRYIDRASKKEVTVTGVIDQESPAGIKLKGKKPADGKVIPALDVTQVIYKTAAVTALEFRAPFGKEDRALRETGKKREALLSDAQAGYEQLEGQLRDSANARRYIQYKIANIAALRAQDDPTKVDAAIKALSDFKAGNASGWEIVPALRTLAKLQEDSGKVDDARKTYEELAALPDAPNDVKQEADILVARLLLRTGKFADAEKRLKGLGASLAKDDPQRGFIQAYLAASHIGQNNLEGAGKQLTEAIRASRDGRLKGLAYNLLGDYSRKKGQPEEAFWQYLRVDALYNEDPEEQAKALYYLRELFDSQKRDPIRAKECARRLQADKRLAGTVYQRLAAGKDKEK